jgi:hypothetical protein
MLAQLRLGCPAPLEDLADVQQALEAEDQPVELGTKKGWWAALITGSFRVVPAVMSSDTSIAPGDEKRLSPA